MIPFCTAGLGTVAYCVCCMLPWVFVMQQNIVFNKTINWSLVRAVLESRFSFNKFLVWCFFTAHQLYRFKPTESFGEQTRKST